MTITFSFVNLLDTEDSHRLPVNTYVYGEEYENENDDQDTDDDEELQEERKLLTGPDAGNANHIWCVV